MVINWRKQQHYFIVRLSQDLFGDWVLIRSWGNLSNGLAGCKQDVISCRQQAMRQLDAIRRRQQSRGYSEVSMQPLTPPLAER